MMRPPMSFPKKPARFLLGATLILSACENEKFDPRLVETTNAGLPKINGGTNGDENYCTFAGPCLAREGDCDQATHCVTGVTCFANTGASFGFDPTVDMCLDDTCDDGILNGSETEIDCGPGCIPCPPTIFVDSFGDTGDERVLDSAVDSQGNVIVAGSFNNSADLGGSGLTAFGSTGRRDVFVAKYDSDGTHLWTRHFGGDFSDGDGAVSVSVGGRDVIGVAGNFHRTADFDGTSAGVLNLTSNSNSSDAFAVLLETDGTTRWANRYGGSGYDLAYGIDVDVVGNVLVVGSFEGTVNFGDGNRLSSGQADAFVVRIRGSNGAFLRSFRYGGTGQDQALAIDTAPSRDTVVVGTFTSTITLDGVDFGTAGDKDAFVMQINPYTLRRLSAVQIGGVRDEVASDVAIDNNDNIYVNGNFMRTVDFGGGARTVQNNNIDAFVVAYDSTLSHRWDVTYGSTDIDQGTSVSVDGTDLAIAANVRGAVNGLTGVTGTYSGSIDVLSAVLDSSDGSVIDAQIEGGTGADRAASVVMWNDQITAVGSFVGTATYGGVTLVSAGGNDVVFNGRLIR